jgi:hypothetical protein
MDPLLVRRLITACAGIRLYRVRPQRADGQETELLAIVPPGRKGACVAILSGTGLRVDVITSDTFETGAPSYFHRCEPVDTASIVSSEEAAELERRALIRAELTTIEALVVTARQSTSDVISRQLGFRFARINVHTLQRLDESTAWDAERTDLAVIDAALPADDAVDAIMRVSEHLEGECIALVVQTARDEKIWRQVQGLGVLRLEGATSQFEALFAAAQRRNASRVAARLP